MASTTYLLALLSALLALYYFRKRPETRKLPPGPKEHFLLGNLSALMVEGEKRAKTYAKWFDEYGSIMHLSIFGGHSIILNSAEAASDLMDKRAAMYSHRPRMVMYNELVGNDWLMIATSGEPHRERRSLAQRYFLSQFKDWQNVQLDSGRTLLRNLLANPKDWASLIRLNAASTILRICYGYEVTSADDKLLKIVQDALEVPRNGPYFVDFFPWLKHYPSWLPGGRFHQDAAEAKTIMQLLRDAPFEMVCKEMAAGTASPSFISTLLSQLPPDEDLEHSYQARLIRETVTVMYAASMDTTVSFMYTLLGAMVLYPDVQRRAQNELDAVLGQHQLPTFDDRPSLPFIEATVLEVLRWTVVTPLGFPHMVIEDDEYHGYWIPKGSTVFGNMWAILRDPVVFPNPERFDPSRFLSKTEGNAAARKVIESTVFGWGRRTCPGRHVGHSALFIMISHILACFDICKPVDEAGKEFEPVPKYDETPLVRRALPVPCTIKARRPDKIMGLDMKSI